jgi:hypothetical protein
MRFGLWISPPEAGYGYEPEMPAVFLLWDNVALWVLLNWIYNVQQDGDWPDWLDPNDPPVYWRWS